MGKGHRASMPSLGMPLSPNLQVFIDLEALQTPSFWVFMEGGTKTSNPLLLDWFPWQPAPILKNFPNVTALTQTLMSLTEVRLENQDNFMILIT